MGETRDARELIEGMAREWWNDRMGRPMNWSVAGLDPQDISNMRAALLYLLTHLPEGTDLRALREEVERM